MGFWRGQPLLAAAALLMGLSAVATPAGGGTPAAIAHSTAPDQALIRVDLSGGFVAPQSLIQQMPLFVLYGDGSAITQGPHIAIYPGPALPNLLVTRLNEDGIQAVLRAAQDAGLLDGDHTYPGPHVSDMPTTVFTVHANGRTTVVSAYALGFEANQPNLPVPDRAARAKLTDFLGHVTSLSSVLPAADIAQPESSYTIERLQIISQPAAAEGTPQPGTPALGGEADWPLSTPLAQFGVPSAAAAVLPQGRCGVVAGADAHTLVAALQRANELTLWRSGGALYRVYARPLLPDESGCPARPAATPAP